MQKPCWIPHLHVALFIYILFLGEATDQNHGLCLINENILQWLGFPLKWGFLCNWPCSNADKGGKVSSRAGRVCFPGWQVAYMVTCGSELLVKRGMVRELKHIPRTSSLPWQCLWLCALGIVTKTHASGFRDRNGHLFHRGHRQGRALPWPCSSGMPGCHGSGHCGSRKLHMLLQAQQRHSLTPEHRSQGCCKTLHEVLLAMPRGMSLKNHILWKKKESKDFWFCIFHSGRKIPGKARK